MTPRLALIHWQPIEMFPPAMNLVRYFAAGGRWEIEVFTTRSGHGLREFDPRGVRIHRTAAPGESRAWRKVRSYVGFHLGAAWRMTLGPPDVVLYVEPRSALPAYVASLFRRFPLFIHHHEYHEPAEFDGPGMRLPRALHALEKRRLFGRADWISHTNEDRIELFLADQPSVDPAVCRTLPNFPPASWFGAPNRAWTAGEQAPLRMVYVGSLSEKTTYIREAVAWIRGLPAGKATLDIFAYNLHAETRAFLTATQGCGVRFFPDGIPYDDLPRVLRDYHTGLLLYRANSTNYRLNASNKLFEYLACGLDVIFPGRMLGVKPYARRDAAPRVIEVDFETGAGLDLATLSDRSGLEERPWREHAGSVLRGLEEAMLGSLGVGDTADELPPVGPVGSREW